MMYAIVCSHDSPVDGLPMAARDAVDSGAEDFAVIG